MASRGIGEIDVSDSGPSSQPYGVLHGINTSTSTTLMNEGSAFDFGEFEEAIVLQGIRIRNDEGKTSNLLTSKASSTLEMFPSWPIRFQQTPTIVASHTSPSLTIPYGGSKSGGGESTDSGSTELQFETESPVSIKASSSSEHHNHNNHDAAAAALTTSQNQSKAISPQHKKKGDGSTSEKALDPKTLRRLAQNREAAKKSRLRKKAYVQQLETSRLRLSNLEQDLQRARSRGLFLGGGNISPGAAMFDMEYARWLEEDQRHLVEIRAALETTLPDNEVRVSVDRYLGHYNELFRLKGIAVKSDVFHLIKGIWASPAERPFIWIGGFKPSDLILMLSQQLEPLAEQQRVGISVLRQSLQQTEDALSKGHEHLHLVIVDTIAGGPIVDGVQQMAAAMARISNLEKFVHEADNLRQQTLHQLCRILTVRQAIRCFLIIGEYYGRLRALSSLWTSRPRENLMNEDNSCQAITTELQMVHPSQTHFSSL